MEKDRAAASAAPSANPCGSLALQSRAPAARPIILCIYLRRGRECGRCGRASGARRSGKFFGRPCPPRLSVNRRRRIQADEESVAPSSQTLSRRKPPPTLHSALTSPACASECSPPRHTQPRRWKSRSCQAQYFGETTRPPHSGARRRRSRSRQPWCVPLPASRGRLRAGVLRASVLRCL